MKRVLVCGATGELGRHVVEEAARRGWSVRALSRRPVEIRGTEVHVGDALRPESVKGAMDGVDAVFSCVGAKVMPGLRGWRGFLGVDWPANRNLIAAARAAGVKRFVYVSTAHDEAMRRLAYVRAHERVVDELRASGLAWAAIRPTGFFSALASIQELARGGAAPMLGRGEHRSNPIHDADLAAVCADALDGEDGVIGAGGPDVLTRREMYELAFAGLGKPTKIRHAPAGLARVMSWPLRLVHPRMGQLVEFFAALDGYDVVAPVRGKRRLGDFYAGKPQ